MFVLWGEVPTLGPYGDILILARKRDKSHCYILPREQRDKSRCYILPHQKWDKSHFYILPLWVFVSELTHCPIIPLPHQHIISSVHHPMTTFTFSTISFNAFSTTFESGWRRIINPSPS